MQVDMIDGKAGERSEPVIQLLGVRVWAWDAL